MRTRYPFNMPIDRGGFPSEKPQTTGLLRSWRKRSYEQQAEDLAALVASNHALKDALMGLRTASRTDNIVGNVVLQEAEKQCTASGEILREMVEPKFFNRCHGTRSTTAEKFFDVAEVAEHVMTYLEIIDVLALQRVNKRTFAIIAGSKKLQRKLHLLPDPQAVARGLAFRSRRSKIFYPRGHGNLRNLDVAICRPGCNSNYSTELASFSLSVELQFPEYDGSLALLGERVGNMLICQPPITTVDVEISCCQGKFRKEADIISGGSEDDEGEQRLQLRKSRRQAWRTVQGGRLGKVKNEEGIRLRDLLDACQKWAKQHELCPYAHRGLHDGEGKVMPDLRFDGIFSPHTAAPPFQLPWRLESASPSPPVRLPVPKNGAPGSLSAEDEAAIAESDRRAAEKELHENLMWGYLKEKQRGKCSATTFCRFLYVTIPAMGHKLILCTCSSRGGQSHPHVRDLQGGE